MALCSTTPNPVSRTAHSARSSMARARGTPAGSVSNSETLIGCAWASVIAAPLGGICFSRGRFQALSSLVAPSSLLSPDGAAPSGRVVAGLADGHLGSFQQFLAQTRGQQDARLVLQHTGIEGGEDGPHPVFVQPLHDELGALRVAELQAHDQPVLPD